MCTLLMEKAKLPYPEEELEAGGEALYVGPRTWRRAAKESWVRFASDRMVHTFAPAWLTGRNILLKESWLMDRIARPAGCSWSIWHPMTRKSRRGQPSVPPCWLKAQALQLASGSRSTHWRKLYKIHYSRFKAKIRLKTVNHCQPSYHCIMLLLISLS